MPALTLELKPPGRRALVHKAVNRHKKVLAKDEKETAVVRTPKAELKEPFNAAARNEGWDNAANEGDASGEGGREPIPAGRVRRMRRQLMKHFEQAASGPNPGGSGDSGGGGGGGGGDGPSPTRTPAPENEFSRAAETPQGSRPRP